MYDYLFYTLLFFSSTLIAWQDLKDQLVSLWLLLLYLLIIIGFTYLEGGIATLLENAIGVVAYFGICFTVLFGYYFWKEKKWPKIIDSKLGKADLIIFLAIGISLPLLELILFFTIAFCSAALAALLLFKNKNAIPLAGILVILYFVFVIFKAGL